MKSHSSRALAYGLIFVIALATAACGGTRTSSPSAPTPAPSTPPPAAAPAAKAAPQAAAPVAAPAQPAAVKPAPKKIAIGTTIVALSFAPLHAAVAAGFFKEENLEVEEIVIAGAAPFVALSEGKLDAFLADTVRMYQFAESGDTKFLVVQKILDAVTMDVTVSKAFAQKKGVTPQSPLEDRLKALKGAKWGVTSLGGAPQVMLSYLGNRAGLNAQTDMEFVATQTVPAYMAAIKNGQLDGFMASPPMARWRKRMGSA